MIEAEDAVSLPSPWEVVDDETAPGGQYITTPAGTHTLEVSYREHEIPFDLILVTSDLDR